MAERALFTKSRIPVTSMLTVGALPSALRRAVYRRRGYRIGVDVEFAPGVVIQADEVEIGPGASFGLGTVIRGRKVRIGARAQVGSFCFFEGRDISVGDDTVIREQVFVGGPLFRDSLLEIGKRVKVFQTCFLNPSRPLRIGDETGVGGRSSIFTHGSWQSVLEGFPVAFEEVNIGKNVWLPWHVFILPGVSIGDNATIGAGSVINRSIPAGALAAGVPAKVLRGPDEWPRRVQGDQQWALARSIFAALLDHLEDEGARVERDIDGASAERLPSLVSTIHGAGRLALVKSAAAVQPEDEVIVILSGGPGEPAPPSWCSLLDRRRGGLRSPLALETEEFISRWGIRFDPGEEG